MVDCDECGDETNMPYNCRFCGGSYCSKHRLPENHACDGLSSYKKSLRDEGRMYDYPSGQDSSPGILGRLSGNFSLGAFRGNVTYLLLAIMVVTYLLQHIVIFTFGGAVHQAIFVIRPGHLEYVWTWITSIFAHRPFGLFHIFVNGLVLYFFGIVTERRIGSKRFLMLFLAAGVVAGVSRTVVVLFVAGPEALGALGASGAIMAVMGVLTVLNPNLRVYLWFILPMPLWVITLLFAGYDFFLASTGGLGAGGVARLAHLSGLALGLLYGWKLKQEGVSVGRQIRFSGPGGPGGGRRPPGF